MSARSCQNTVSYRNLLDNPSFEEGKPSIEALTELPGAQVKRVLLKAGLELKCHKTQDHVLVIWLRGKAQFMASGETFVMHPGSMLEMPSGTPHGAIAETDCVFTVVKIKSDT